MTEKELLERARYMVASLHRDSQIFKLDAKEVLDQLDTLLNDRSADGICLGEDKP